MPERIFVNLAIADVEKSAAFFMYGRSFEDLDGHVIESVWMDLDATLAAMGSHQAA